MAGGDGLRERNPVRLYPGRISFRRGSFSSLVYHEDLQRVVAEVQEYTCRGETRFEQEYRIVTKEGDIRWIDDRTVVERDADRKSYTLSGHRH